MLNFPYFQPLADEDMQEKTMKEETCIFNSSPGFKVKL